MTLRKYTAALLALFALLATAAVTAPVAAQPEGTPGGQRVEAIIQFDQTPTPADAAAVGAVGGEVGYRLENINVLTVIVPEPALQGLSQRPGVVSVELARQDIAFHDHETTDGAELQWGVNRVDAEYASNDGLGAVVAILDTGLDTGHPEFSGRVLTEAMSFAGRTASTNVSDKNGHGTHVAGIVGAASSNGGVVGVAPQADILPIQIAKGSRIKDESILAALNYVLGLVGADLQNCIGNGSVDVINMSYGGGARSDAEEDALNCLDAAGVTLVSSAGNSSGGLAGFPAAYGSVIAVSSTTPSDTLSSFSSVGLTLEDLAAPGSNIYSTYKDGGYAHMSGTSMASPHVAGAAAVLAAANTPNVRSVLTATAENIGLSESERGAGLLDVAPNSGDNLGNRAPVVDAGPDQTVEAGKGALLAGAASDPDGHTITVKWAVESGDGVFTSDSTAGTTFTPSSPGEHVLSLTATETASENLSSSDTVVVTALDPNVVVETFSVTDIRVSRTSKGRWQDVTFVVSVATDTGDGDLEGAVVTADVERSGRVFADMVQTTNGNGEASFTIRRALAEDYWINVTDVSHPDPNLVWSGGRVTYLSE